MRPLPNSLSPGHYMYAEAAGKASGAKATLSSPWMALNTDCNVRFSYFIYGDKSGSLWLNQTSSYTSSSVSSGFCFNFIKIIKIFNLNVSHSLLDLIKFSSQKAGPPNSIPARILKLLLLWGMRKREKNPPSSCGTVHYQVQTDTGSPQEW